MNRFALVPQATHMVGTKWIIKYIKRTTNYGIIFSWDGSDGLISYTNEDQEKKFDKRKSIYNKSIFQIS
jgi:hypothetical protein